MSKMTEGDLDAIEEKAKHQLKGPCTGMAYEVLELIAELRNARATQDHWQRVATIIAGVLADYQKPAGVPLHKRNSQEQILSVASYAAARDAVEKEGKE